jgi:hypothetical protein
MDSPHIQELVKLSLYNQLENLNPFMLRKTMDKKLKIIFSIINTSVTSPRFIHCAHIGIL